MAEPKTSTPDPQKIFEGDYFNLDLGLDSDEAELFREKALNDCPELLTQQLEWRNSDGKAVFSGTLLHYALYFRNGPLVHQILKHLKSEKRLPEESRKAVLSAHDANGNFPLQIAAEGVQYSIAVDLLKAGAPVEQTDSSGANIIHWLVRGNFSDCSPLDAYLKALPEEQRKALVAIKIKLTEDSRMRDIGPYDMLQDSKMIPFLLSLDDGAAALAKDENNDTPISYVVDRLLQATGQTIPEHWIERNCFSHSVTLDKLYAFHKAGKLDKDQDEHLILNSIAWYIAARNDVHVEIKNLKEIPAKVYQDYVLRSDVTEDDKARIGSILTEKAVWADMPELLAGVLKAGYVPEEKCIATAELRRNPDIVDLLIPFDKKGSASSIYFYLDRCSDEQAEQLLTVLKKHNVQVTVTTKATDCSHPQEEGLTPLLLEARRGNVDSVFRLLKYNAVYTPEQEKQSKSMLNWLPVPGLPHYDLCREAEETIRGNRLAEDHDKPLDAHEQAIIHMIDCWRHGLPVLYPVFMHKEIFSLGDVPHTEFGELSPNVLAASPQKPVAPLQKARITAT